MIKLTYETVGEGLTKPEITKVRIFDGKQFVSYNIAGKAESVVQQMRKDGRKRVFYSRGQMIQIFRGKKEEEILEIAKKDMENGLKVAESKGQKLKIQNVRIEKKNEI
jgi:hypothetical protein